MQLPQDLLASLEQAPGFNKEAFISVHQKEEKITSIRLNPLKRVDSSILPPARARIPWSSNGYYLHERPIFTFDPLLHGGAYYVQEASSMFLEEAYRQLAPSGQSLKVLDLSAAPGGKSTLLLSMLGTSGMLVSNEVIKSRANILQENITKWGSMNCIITNNDPRDFSRLEGFFDIIVVDAPCSGSGLFRRDPEAVGEWSTGNVDLCSRRQQRILADVLPALRTNGILIYSTCSYSMEEDEEIISWLVGTQQMNSLRLSLDPSWGIVESCPRENSWGYRFYPDRLEGEGFFIACFKKDAEQKELLPRPKKIEKATKKEAEIIAGYLSRDLDVSFWKHQDNFLIIPKSLETEFEAVFSSLYIRKAGINAGRIMGGDLVPDHELALSGLLREDIPRVNLILEEALQDLRKEELVIDLNLRGWALAVYENLPLGWMKILPNRINNYYPKEWRILKKSNN